MAKLTDNRIKSQQERILKWLQVRPLTTFQAREKLNIVRPDARICELRQAGHNIATTMIKAKDRFGFWHSVARYALLASKENKNG
jgi:hypothetical protein